MSTLFAPLRFRRLCPLPLIQLLESAEPSSGRDVLQWIRALIVKPFHPLA
jgi:hypothetical protein